MLRKMGLFSRARLGEGLLAPGDTSPPGCAGAGAGRAISRARAGWCGPARRRRICQSQCSANSGLADSWRHAVKPRAPTSAREATVPLFIQATIACNGGESKRPPLPAVPGDAEPPSVTSAPGRRLYKETHRRGEAAGAGRGRREGRRAEKQEENNELAGLYKLNQPKAAPGLISLACSNFGGVWPN